MAEYPGIVLTNTGLDMIAESQTGKSLIFTKIKIGDGLLGEGESISTLTALKSSKLDIPIQGGLNQGSGQVRLRYLVDNSGVPVNQGFFAREVGLYAKLDEAGTEKLYAYTNGGNKVDWIPDKNTPMDAQIFDIFVLIGNASNVTFTIDGSATYATILDLAEHNEDANAHKTLQDVIKTKGNALSRNVPLFGPLSGDNMAAYLIGIGSNQITLKAGTLLSFADGMGDLGPLEHIEKVPADISLALAAAGVYTVPLAYTDDLCNSGTAISSGDYSGRAANNAFDNNSNSTVWSPSVNGASTSGTAWIGYNFGAAKRIRKVNIYSSTEATAVVSSVKVQYSDDGLTWSGNITLNNLASGWVANTIPDVGAHQYWRILANSNPSSGVYWGIHEMEMMEALQTHYLYADRNTTSGTITLGSTKQKPRILAISDIYTDNLCIGGAAISGGDYANTIKEFAFDGTEITGWESSQTGTGIINTAYIGYFFGVARHIRKIYVSQDITSGVSSIKVQRSTDGSMWIDVLATALPGNASTIVLPASAPTPYWRVLATAQRFDATAGGWRVQEITMHEVATELLWHEPTEGKSRWYDGNAWTGVERIQLGSVNIDSSGKIVSLSMNPYGLSRLRALPGETSDDVVTMGQFIELVPDKAYRFPNGLILQMGTSGAVAAGGSLLVTLPVAFEKGVILHASGTPVGAGTNTNASGLGIGVNNKSQITIYDWGTISYSAVRYFLIGK